MSKQFHTRILPVIIFLLLCQTVIFGQDAFYTQLDQFKKIKNLQNASWSLTVYNITEQKEIISVDGDKSLIPASTLKAVTTISAFEMLGPDFTFTTSLYYGGEIGENGSLDGDIFIKGGGDPTLGFKRHGFGISYNQILNRWYQKIKDNRIKEINGKVIGDGTIYESSTVSPKWIWEDIGNYYGAGISGLNLHENQYNVVFQPGKKVGDSTLLSHTIPDIPGFSFTNEVLTGNPGSGDQAFIYCAPFTNNVFIRGTIPPGDQEYYVHGAIPDPPLFASESLYERMRVNGVNCTQNASTCRLQKSIPNYNNLVKIDSIISPPLHKMIWWGNHKSINLYNESFVKAIGLQVYQRGQSDLGLLAIERYWKRQGFNAKGFHVVDGSGLSPLNALTTRHYTWLLNHASKQDYFPAFKASLKEYNSGTIFAKSGYITRVRGYVGYTYSSCGDLLAFALLVNQFEGDKSYIRQKMMNLIISLSKLEYY